MNTLLYLSTTILYIMENRIKTNYVTYLPIGHDYLYYNVLLLYILHIIIIIHYNIIENLI